MLARVVMSFACVILAHLNARQRGAPPTDTLKPVTLLDEVREIIRPKCGSCHTSGLPTAKPGAIAVFDLAEEDWPSTISPRQLERFRRRLSSLDSSQTAVIESFVTEEIRRPSRRGPSEVLDNEEPMKAKELLFAASKSTGKVSALLMLPKDAQWLLVLAHGAGAGMRHRFMDQISEVLASEGIGTFRYQFPYMEGGSRRPDPKPVLYATVRSAVSAAEKHVGGLPLLAGGKSMGGRMTSMASAEEPLDGVKGIVFVGFPLHPAGQPSIERAAHLQKVTVPMLFLQGTRDTLADLTLLKPVCKSLGKRATLHIIDGADHSFHVLKSSGTSDESVLIDLARTTRTWADLLRG